MAIIHSSCGDLVGNSLSLSTTGICHWWGLVWEWIVIFCMGLHWIDLCFHRTIFPIRGSYLHCRLHCTATKKRMSFQGFPALSHVNWANCVNCVMLFFVLTVLTFLTVSLPKRSIRSIRSCYFFILHFLHFLHFLYFLTVKVQIVQIVQCHFLCHFCHFCHVIFLLHPPHLADKPLVILVYA